MLTLLFWAFCALLVVALVLPLCALALEVFLRCLPLIPAVLFALWLFNGCG